MLPSDQRPMTSVSIQIPVDVLEDLKRVAPKKEMSGHQALIKYYIGQGLREDLRNLWEKEEKRSDS
jgi:hypothetical protein